MSKNKLLTPDASAALRAPGIDKLLMPEAAADALLVSERTLAKWRSTGENNIAFVKIGKSVRYRASDIQAYIERNIKQGAAA